MGIRPSPVEIVFGCDGSENNIRRRNIPSGVILNHVFVIPISKAIASDIDFGLICVDVTGI